MATLITGLGLVGTSFAQLALKRGERVLFYDLQKGIKGEVARINQEQARDFEYIYDKDLGRVLDLVARVPMPPKSGWAGHRSIRWRPAFKTTSRN